MKPPRLNQWLAQATGLSRRAADIAIADGRVKINQQLAGLGQTVGPSDQVTLDGHPVATQTYHYVVLNKPVGYVASREKQGSAPTVYKLLPPHFHQFKPVGRLDKDSSGLMLLTNDGELANQLTHPSRQKAKVYRVKLNKPLSPKDLRRIEQGVELADGRSAFKVKGSDSDLVVTLFEGRNRQIRRTFEALGYKVTALLRTNFGKVELGDLPSGRYREIKRADIL